MKINRGRVKLFLLMNICSKKLFFFFFLSLAGYFNQDHLKAQTEKTYVSKEMEQRGLESRRARQEPSFFKTGSRLRWQGVFFGVGFRDLVFELNNGKRLVNSNSAQNGAAFNLGLFEEQIIYEFERQVSIMDSKNFLEIENQRGHRLEVIQNTLAYSWFPRLRPDLHAQVGFGIQSSQTRLAAIGSPKNFHSDTSVSLQLGIAYYPTSNFLIFIRHSESKNFGKEIFRGNPLIKNSSIRTLYLNYFFHL